MKTAIVFFLILGANSFSYAATIYDGQFNFETQKVELDVSYNGGCSAHSFKLDLLKECTTSSGVRCDLILVHSADQPDRCQEHINIRQDLELDLPKGMFIKMYLAFYKDNVDSNRALVTVFGGGTISFQLSKPCSPPDMPAGEPWVVPALGESCPRIPICGLETPPPCNFGP